jgi:hypothetical protein
MEDIYDLSDCKTFLNKLLEYVARRERATGDKVTAIRLDNAREFKGDAITE